MKITRPQFAAIALAAMLASLAGCASSGSNQTFGPQPWAGQAYQPYGNSQPLGFTSAGTAPPAGYGEKQVYRSQTPEFGGRGFNPLSPQEQSQPTTPPPAAYIRSNYPGDG